MELIDPMPKSLAADCSAGCRSAPLKCGVTRFGGEIRRSERPAAELRSPDMNLHGLGPNEEEPFGWTEAGSAVERPGFL